MATIPEVQIKADGNGRHVMEPEIFRVRRVRKETHDTFTLDLEPKNGSGKFEFQPGQFNMLYLFGVGEAPISISGDPSASKTLTHTIRAVGTVTKQMQKLKKDDTLGVRGPFGAPWPVEEGRGKDIVIVAGGIGLAPLRPTLYKVLREREKYGKVVLLYGARTPEDMLFRAELEQWRARFDVEALVSVDRGTGKWLGNIGVVTFLIPKATFDASNCLAMVCGPEVMMRFTILELMKRGLPQDKIYLSMERSMRCGIGHCGHCQFGHTFICKDGPVFRYDLIVDLLRKRDI